MLSFCASVRLRRAEAIIPSNSFFEAGSALRFPILTRLSSSCLPMQVFSEQVLLRTNDENLWGVVYLADDRSFFLPLPPPILLPNQARIDLPMHPILCLFFSFLQIAL